MARAAIAWLAFFGSVGRVLASDRSGSEPPFAVAAYLPEWRYEGANWDYMARTVTHMILFSLEPTPDGRIVGMDRFPRPALLEEAREAAIRHKTKLLICFGGNGRSGGFAGMVRSAEARKAFIDNLLELCRTHGLDGVDYNWEYPGYTFGRGYAPHNVVAAEYAGLAALVQETRKAFDSDENLSSADTITLAYYPDGRQETLLQEHKGLLEG